MDIYERMSVPAPSLDPEDLEMASLTSRLRRRNPSGSSAALRQKSRPISYPPCVSFTELSSPLRPGYLNRATRGLMDRKPQKLIEPIDKEIALRVGRRVKFADEAGKQLVSYVEIPDKFERFGFRSLTNINSMFEKASRAIDERFQEITRKSSKELFDDLFSSSNTNSDDENSSASSPGQKRKHEMKKHAFPKEFFPKSTLFSSNELDSPVSTPTHFVASRIKTPKLSSSPHVKLRKYSLDESIICEHEEDHSLCDVTNSRRQDGGEHSRRDITGTDDSMDSVFDDNFDEFDPPSFKTKGKDSILPFDTDEDFRIKSCLRSQDNHMRYETHADKDKQTEGNPDEGWTNIPVEIIKSQSISNRKEGSDVFDKLRIKTKTTNSSEDTDKKYKELLRKLHSAGQNVDSEEDKDSLCESDDSLVETSEAAENSAPRNINTDYFSCKFEDSLVESSEFVENSNLKNEQEIIDNSSLTTENSPVENSTNSNNSSVVTSNENTDLLDSSCSCEDSLVESTVHNTIMTSSYESSCHPECVEELEFTVVIDEGRKDQTLGADGCTSDPSVDISFTYRPGVKRKAGLQKSDSVVMFSSFDENPNISFTIKAPLGKENIDSKKVFDSKFSSTASSKSSSDGSFSSSLSDSIVSSRSSKSGDDFITSTEEALESISNIFKSMSSSESSTDNLDIIPRFTDFTQNNNKLTKEKCNQTVIEAEACFSQNSDMGTSISDEDIELISKKSKHKSKMGNSSNFLSDTESAIKDILEILDTVQFSDDNNQNLELVDSLISVEQSHLSPEPGDTSSEDTQSIHGHEPQSVSTDFKSYNHNSMEGGHTYFESESIITVIKNDDDNLISDKTSENETTSSKSDDVENNSEYDDILTSLPNTSRYAVDPAFYYNSDSRTPDNDTDDNGSLFFESESGYGTHSYPDDDNLLDDIQSFDTAYDLQEIDDDEDDEGKPDDSFHSDSGESSSAAEGYDEGINCDGNTGKHNKTVKPYNKKIWFDGDKTSHIHDTKSCHNVKLNSELYISDKSIENTATNIINTELNVAKDDFISSSNPSPVTYYSVITHPDNCKYKAENEVLNERSAANKHEIEHPETHNKTDASLIYYKSATRVPETDHTLSCVSNDQEEIHDGCFDIPGLTSSSIIDDGCQSVPIDILTPAAKSKTSLNSEMELKSKHKCDLDSYLNDITNDCERGSDSYSSDSEPLKNNINSLIKSSSSVERCYTQHEKSESSNLNSDLLKSRPNTSNFENVSGNSTEKLTHCVTASTDCYNNVQSNSRDVSLHTETTTAKPATIKTAGGVKINNTLVSLPGARNTSSQHTASQHTNNQGNNTMEKSAYDNNNEVCDGCVGNTDCCCSLEGHDNHMTLGSAESDEKLCCGEEGLTFLRDECLSVCVALGEGGDGLSLVGDEVRKSTTDEINDNVKHSVETADGNDRDLKQESADQSAILAHDKLEGNKSADEFEVSFGSYTTDSSEYDCSKDDISEDQDVGDNEGLNAIDLNLELGIDRKEQSGSINEQCHAVLSDNETHIENVDEESVVNISDISSDVNPCISDVNENSDFDAKCSVKSTTVGSDNNLLYTSNNDCDNELKITHNSAQKDQLSDSYQFLVSDNTNDNENTSHIQSLSLCSNLSKENIFFAGSESSLSSTGSSPYSLILVRNPEYSAPKSPSGSTHKHKLSRNNTFSWSSDSDGSESSFGANRKHKRVKKVQRGEGSFGKSDKKCDNKRKVCLSECKDNSMSSSLTEAKSTEDDANFGDVSDMNDSVDLLESNVRGQMNLQGQGGNVSLNERDSYSDSKQQGASGIKDNVSHNIDLNEVILNQTDEKKIESYTETQESSYAANNDSKVNTNGESDPVIEGKGRACTEQECIIHNRQGNSGDNVVSTGNGVNQDTGKLPHCECRVSNSSVSEATDRKHCKVRHCGAESELFGIQNTHNATSGEILCEAKASTEINDKTRLFSDTGSEIENDSNNHDNEEVIDTCKEFRLKESEDLLTKSTNSNSSCDTNSDLLTKGNTSSCSSDQNEVLSKCDCSSSSSDQNGDSLPKSTDSISSCNQNVTKSSDSNSDLFITNKCPDDVSVSVTITSDGHVIVK